MQNSSKHHVNQEFAFCLKGVCYQKWSHLNGSSKYCFTKIYSHKYISYGQNPFF